ncbi:hypothetical protein LUW77_10905 [Streptomyces radiopugnans]|nr:hypothetical protein LUW77_10905 [Streptomyces radiopugnans]
MTTEMTMPRRGSGPGGVRVRTAVAAALVLSRLRPGRLRRVLTRVSRGARPPRLRGDPARVRGGGRHQPQVR